MVNVIGEQGKGSKPTIDDFVSKANFEFQARRIKMSFSQAKRDKLFDELTDYNNELRTLLDTSDRIAALRQNNGLRKKSATSKGLWQFWRHADQLYTLLTQSWRCECQGLHRANLLLQHRTNSNVDFRIIFVYAQQNLKPKPWSWTCQETNIKLLEEEWHSNKSTVSFTTITSIASNESNSSRTQSQVGSVPKAKLKKSSLRKSIIGRFKKDKPNSCNAKYVS
jgi:hypothetical protein